MGPSKFNPGRFRSAEERDERLHLSYTKRHDGRWFLEWRVDPNSAKPITARPAHDTEIALIEELMELRARIAPKLVKLRPFKVEDGEPQ